MFFQRLLSQSRGIFPIRRRHCRLVFRLAFVGCWSGLLVGPIRLLADGETAVREPAPHASVVIVTGEDYPGHQWQETAPRLQEILEEDPRLRVDLATDIDFLRTDQLHRYDAVVLHFKNYDRERPGRRGLVNLQRFVEKGGGVTLTHFACGAFEKFKDEFEKIAGRVWMGLEHGLADRRQHDPYGTFTVHYVEASKPAWTNGLSDFETTDELYTCLVGETPITTVATANSRIDGKGYPVAFTLTVGKGKVFHSVLGHDVKSYESRGMQELTRRGIAWTAGLKIPTAAPAATGE